jgi:hypothetical protein
MAKKAETGPQFKMPSALTHGAFSTMAFRPGEDPNQFKRLVLDLTAELVPLGAMEEETVLALAGYIWRRRRIERSFSAQIFLSRSDPSHPAYDKHLHEVATLKAELQILEDNPQYAAKVLETYAAEVRVEFELKFPRKNYSSESEWALAISEQLKAKIHLQLELAQPLLSLNEVAASASPSAIIDAAHVLRDDLSDKELVLLQRIDKMIEGMLRRFYTLKGMKQTLVSPLLANHVPQHKKLPIDQAAPPQC